ncbi:TPA: hypothetical protein ACRXS6_006859, partial [Pseudomonas aeruginosa]
TPFHSLVPIFPIPSRYISIFRAPPPRYFSPSLTLERFQARLKEVEATIRTRNQARRRPYEYLLPSRIPASTNI